MCTPSRSEGFGLVFIEALASECVVVTSDIAPMNEFIKDGENGLLVKDFENPAMLADAIQRACCDQELRKTIKSHSRNSVQCFEKKTIDRREAQCYERILSMKKKHELGGVLMKRVCETLQRSPFKRKQKIIQKGVVIPYKMALDWIKKHSLPEQGVIISTKQRAPYPEVTGYMIPTLIEAGEMRLARHYSEFLSYMQRPNGAFTGPDGKEYLFDSGQALRGLVLAATYWEKFKPAALKTADYLLDQRSDIAISDNSVAYLMDDLSRFDIDGPLDFKLVEFLMKEEGLNFDKLFK